MTSRGIMSQWDIYHPSFLFFGCFQGSWVPLLTSNLNKEAPVFDSTTVLRWSTFFLFIFTLVRIFFYCLFPIFSSAFSHSMCIGLRLLVGLHWQRHSGDGRLFHGVMQFSGAVRRRGYGVLKPRRVKAPWGFPCSLVWGKEAASVSPQGEKNRDTTLSSEGNAQSAGNGGIKTNRLGLLKPCIKAPCGLVFCLLHL